MTSVEGLSAHSNMQGTQKISSIWALLFGLSSAPQIFTKMPITLVATLRRDGIQIHLYLDHILVCSPTLPLAKTHMNSVINTLEQHGYLFNRQNSQIAPTQKTTHLGVLIDTTKSMLSVPEEKITKTSTVTRQISKMKTSKLMTLAKLQGLMISSIDTVPWARLHLHPLQWSLRPHQLAILQRKDKNILVTCPPRGAYYGGAGRTTSTRACLTFRQRRDRYSQMPA